MKTGDFWAKLGVLASLITIITFVTGRQSIQKFLADTPPSERIDESGPQPPPTEAIIHTSAGVISLRLLGDHSPEHVARFVDLAREGFYDSVEFRRAVPGVLVEANYRSDNPPSASYQHPELSDVPLRRGLVGISRAGNPLRESWQFFILTADAPYLSGMYTPVAEVQEGMDVVDSIAQATLASRWQSILSVDLR